MKTAAARARRRNDVVSPADYAGISPMQGGPEIGGGVVESLSVVLVLLVVAGVAMWMRGTGASPGPRLTDDLAPAMLARAGFPVTRHNVLALRERLGASFLLEARRRGDATDGDWDRVAAACERARCETAASHDDTDLASWPQRVLDEIAAVDPRAAALVAHRCPRMLLDAVGSGRGFLGGSLFTPLARGPVVPVAVTAPVTATVPAPRRALDAHAAPAMLPVPRAAV